MGVQTMIVEETPWIGGMLTAAGVSCIDGNYRLQSGIFGEFADSLALRYGGWDALKTGWVSNINFEPHVGQEILTNIAAGCDDKQIPADATSWWEHHGLEKYSEHRPATRLEAAVLIDALFHPFSYPVDYTGSLLNE